MLQKKLTINHVREKFELVIFLVSEISCRAFARNTTASGINYFVFWMTEN